MLPVIRGSSQTSTELVLRSSLRSPESDREAELLELVGHLSSELKQLWGFVNVQLSTMREQIEGLQKQKASEGENASIPVIKPANSIPLSLKQEQDGKSLLNTPFNSLRKSSPAKVKKATTTRKNRGRAATKSRKRKRQSSPKDRIPKVKKRRIKKEIKKEMKQEPGKPLRKSSRAIKKIKEESCQQSDDDDYKQICKKRGRPRLMEQETLRCLRMLPNMRGKIREMVAQSSRLKLCTAKTCLRRMLTRGEVRAVGHRQAGKATTYEVVDKNAPMPHIVWDEEEMDQDEPISPKFEPQFSPKLLFPPPLPHLEKVELPPLPPLTDGSDGMDGKSASGEPGWLMEEIPLPDGTTADPSFLTMLPTFSELVSSEVGKDGSMLDGDSLCFDTTNESLLPPLISSPVPIEDYAGFNDAALADLDLGNTIPPPNEGGR